MRQRAYGVTVERHEIIDEVVEHYFNNNDLRGIYFEWLTAQLHTEFRHEVSVGEVMPKAEVKLASQPNTIDLSNAMSSGNSCHLRIPVLTRSRPEL